MDTHKFFWIASQKYIGEARQSAYSVREHHPNAELVLFTNFLMNQSPGVFNNVMCMQDPQDEYWFLTSTRMMHMAMKSFRIGSKWVYLDTDTHVCAPLDDIFEMLDHFDFVGCHAPGRKTAPTINDIPLCFPEYNIGVLGFRVSFQLTGFFAQWERQYVKYKDVYGNNDQAPLRETIWNELDEYDMNFGTMPTEYNFRFGMGGQVREQVKVLHGRSDDYGALAKTVNDQERTIRAWKPGELK